MTDKERILMAIITKVMPGLYTSAANEYIKSYVTPLNQLKCGDLVFANTTIHPNEFAVGFVKAVNGDCVTIQEIGGERLCDYHNEIFSVIDKDKLGYEILEGIQYATYRKVLDAFNKHANYNTKFKSIRFDGEMCIVQARAAFSTETKFEFRFLYKGTKNIENLITENDVE